MFNYFSDLNGITIQLEGVRPIPNAKQLRGKYEI